MGIDMALLTFTEAYIDVLLADPGEGNAAGFVVGKDQW